MSVVVKTRHIEKVRVEIPRHLLDDLKGRYGQDVRLIRTVEKDDELSVSIHDSEWLKRIHKETTPGDALRLYRKNRGFTQEELANKLGRGVQKQHISDMERGHRGISKAVAKKLAKVFQTSPERFI